MTRTSLPRIAMLATICSALFITTAPNLFAQTAAPSSAQVAAAKWKELQFLMGMWDANIVGTKVQSAGTYSFQTELNGTVLARHSSQDSCKGPADFDCDHHDLLYLFHSATGDAMQAIYFDNEGHVIHYTVQVTSPVSVVFQSEPGPGPQFRLTYQLADKILHGKFEVAAPGQSAYRSYLEWAGGRK